MKRFLWHCCAALLATMTSCGTSPLASTGIIPRPHAVNWGKGVFHIPETLVYTSDLTGKDSTDLNFWLERAPLRLVQATADEQPEIRLVIDTAVAAEGYRLCVAPDAVSIAASNVAGIFYGLQSFVQLTEHFEAEIPAVVIDDAPRFSYRGSMLDVSRHFRDKEFVKRHLDLLARYKINHFHWHLTDGAGWRIEIKRYPELTDIGAWRPYADWKGWSDGGRRYCHRDDPAAQGGYYTQEEIREVVEYARRLHITVIPEIEMPGHSEEVLAVYPELSCTGKPYTSSDFCIGNEKTYEFLENVLTEVMALFPSQYIHVGGDEAGKGAWHTCPKCQRLMKREGMKHVDELQSYLIHRIEEFLKKNGRSLLGWDEILDGGLAPNATVMSWRGMEGGIAAAKAGHHVVMTPNSHCYLDYYQDDPTREPVAATAFIDLAKTYSYDPAPDSLGAEVVPMILGVQGNLWCEHIATDEHVEHMLWPRMLAIAEVAWSDPAQKNYADFRERALQAVAWMQAHGHHPFDLKNEVGSREESRQTATCLSTGKPVIYNTPYSPKYAAAGDATMTDGLRGGWNFGDKRWMGWAETDMDLIVDLGKEQTVKYIGTDFMQGFFAYIWMPRAVEIAVSDDNQTYTQITVVENDIDEELRGNVYKTFDWSGETQARYVRITARSNGRPGGWIFSDEIIVR